MDRYFEKLTLDRHQRSTIEEVRNGLQNRLETFAPRYGPKDSKRRAAGRRAAPLLMRDS